MREQFIPYELALKLKELGFDEKCFDVYSDGKCNIFGNVTQKPTKNILWQQAFDWFDKKGLSGEVYSSAAGYKWSICKSSYKPEGNCSGGTSICDSGYEGPNSAGCYNTYEEARQACLEKLIEILKNKE